MTNEELKEQIILLVDDEDISKDILILEGDEFADGVIGLSSDYHVIYDYNKTIDSLVQHTGMTTEEAVDFLEYNTLPSLEYMKSKGKAPIFLMKLVN